MSVSHQLFEIRTARDSEHTLEAATQLFATLPEVRRAWWQRLLGADERISFELLWQNQTITWQVYVPSRLSSYLLSLITASYKEAIITELTTDPLDLIFAPAAIEQPVLPDQPPLPPVTPKIALASLKLKHQEYLPLKTFRDFKDIDPLVGVIATLSQLGPDEQVAIQFLLTNTGDRWKTTGQSLISGEKPHPQKALIEKKIASRGLLTALRLAVTTQTDDRSRILLESLAAAFQSMSQSEGNSLTISRPLLDRGGFISAFKERRFSYRPSYHLTLDEVATLYHFPSKPLSHLPNIGWGKNLLGEPPENLPIVYSGMEPEQRREINPFARTTFKNALTMYGLRRSDRRRHLYVIGKTGTGKSTLLANMAINDLKNDEGICIIDPHGDLVETLLDYIPSRRINDVVYFDPSDQDRTVQINLFEGDNIAHRELIASGIVAIFQKLYSYSWGPRLEYILRNALLTLLKSEQARLSDVLELLTNSKFREKVVAELDDPILKNFWVMEFDKMQDRARNEAVAPILNKVGQFVSSPIVRNVVNAHRSSFKIEEIMNEGKILLVNLSQGRLGEDNAALLGAMLITKIQLAAMSRVNIPEEQRRDFYLYVDEFQNFATDSFIKILSEARKYRLNLTLANQYIAQIPEEVQKAIFGNCGSLISFVMGADDAGVFSKEYGDRYSAEDLVSLSKYQIINKVSVDNVISAPFPAMTMALARNNNLNRDKVIRVSRERYAKKRTK